MKYTGGVLVWLAATVCGTMLAERFSKRQKTLEQLFSFFNLMRLEVTHYLLPFPQAVVKTAESLSLKNLGFLGDCAKRIESGEDFPSAWKKSLEKTPPCIGRDEFELLLRFGKTVCSCDIDGVEEILIYYGERFESALTKAAKAKEKYAKLCTFSGIFLGGIIFMIII